MWRLSVNLVVVYNPDMFPLIDLGLLNSGKLQLPDKKERHDYANSDLP